MSLTYTVCPSPCVSNERFAATRQLSLDLVAPLSDADASAQSMPDASPAKWHLAHTTWFFETFVLRDHVSGYRLFDERYPYLFNSYYESEGQRHARPQRGLLTRPSLAQICEWRAQIDRAVIVALPELPPAVHALVELGIQHEQQHQELLLSDLLHLFAQNPLGPVAWATPDTVASSTAGSTAGSTADTHRASPLQWVEGKHGLAKIGHSGKGFGFDCERPQHQVVLTPHLLAHRTVTNREWQQFITDGGYRTPTLWLSDGWAWRQANAITAPAYWRGDESFTLAGWRSLEPHTPVTHVSFYEADAYARWASARLPTEAEWETAAGSYDSHSGHQLDAASSALVCVPQAPSQARPQSPSQARPQSPSQARPQSRNTDSTALQQMFGTLWEWTGSAYRPYPGFCAAPGAIGEYNGKFMSSQFVLRGGSLATPRGHVRASYRNFFYPHQRWQFTGVRLAKDI